MVNSPSATQAVPTDVSSQYTEAPMSASPSAERTVPLTFCAAASNMVNGTRPNSKVLIIFILNMLQI